MTYKEIIKALGICSKVTMTSKQDCKGCPYFAETNCEQELQADALDLINSQKEEIERLADRNHKCIYLSDEETTEYCVDGPCPKFKTEAQIKAEAIKEFAERLKKEFSQYQREYRKVLNGEGACAMIIAKKGIDNLVKEMLGEQ